MVECVFSVPEALGSILSIKKRKEGQKKRKGRGRRRKEKQNHQRSKTVELKMSNFFTFVWNLMNNLNRSYWQ